MRLKKVDQKKLVINDRVMMIFMMAKMNDIKQNDRSGLRRRRRQKRLSWWEGGTFCVCGMLSTAATAAAATATATAMPQGGGYGNMDEETLVAG